MSMLTPDTLVRLETLAREAGAAIMPHYGGPVETELKADRSPVTAADRAAHHVIVAGLTAWDASIPIVSEEGHVPSHDERAGWTHFWLVDPLDGTKEFLKHRDEFTVNIALVEGNAPVLGVVFAPALDRLYVGGRGLGAWKVVHGAAREGLASTPPAPGAPLVVAESRSHPSAELEAYLATVPIARRVQAGSALKFCLVAEGSADIYPRFGPTMEWDSAAGDAVFRYSGRNGERWSPLRYNTPTLTNPPFVIGLPDAGALPWRT
ncbi:MAG TPA: 3'(2'),5'-bisphosphate nucleotidase CysQ [Vicinamibacterales bacterium]|nr:3'(2'),5'-bisphosphate nucleotidase CysQ [Vicinamibacterales bacterium]